MLTIVQFIKQKCSECFRQNRKQDSQELTEWLADSRIQRMRKLTVKPTKDSHLQNDTFIDGSTHQISFNRHSDTLTFPLPTQSSLGRSFCDSPIRISANDLQFYSVESMEESEKRISGLRISERMIENRGKSADQVESYKNVQDCRVQSEAQRLAIWMRSEYSGKVRHFQVRFALRLRAQGRGTVNLLLHKLQDFKVRYLGESIAPSLTASNKTGSLTAYFQTSMVGSSSTRLSHVQAYYRIECSTLALTDFLRMFKNKEVLRMLHGFCEIGLCQAEGWESLQLPQLAVRQGKRQLHLAWQMAERQRTDEQGGLQVLQVGFSMDEGEGGWQRLIKYYLSKKGLIEIYTESVQEAGPLWAEFLRGRFSSLEKLLLKRKLINK